MTDDSSPSKPPSRNDEGPAALSYSSQLDAFRGSHPIVAALLEAAESNRRHRLAVYANGVRLRGLEEFFLRLRDYEGAYCSDPRLEPLAFLITRTSGHFAVGLEASLSGMHAVVHDSMRAAMEIEFLLRDFRHEPAHAAEWLSFDKKKRRKKFNPARLRERHAARAGKESKDMKEAVDYAAHSEMLHASPTKHPLAGYGISTGAGDALGDPVCFVELYEHGRRVLRAAFGYARAVAPEVSIASPDDFEAFRAGWERTQEMHTLLLALLGFPADPKDEIRGRSRRADTNTGHAWRAH